MRTFVRLRFFAAALLGAACGGNVVVGAGGSGGSNGVASGGAGSSGTGGSAGVNCEAGLFPTFSKSCTAVGDCVTKMGAALFARHRQAAALAEG
jgi:hypothetical protein